MNTERQQYIDGLRILAQVLEDNPDISLPISCGTTASSSVTIWCGGDDPREALATAARAFPSTWAKSTSGDGDKWLDLNGQLAGLHVQLYAAREAVCTRRVVGTEDREVEEVVTPAVTRTVTKPVEVVEWECGPVLSRAIAEPAPLPLDVSGDLDAIPANRIGDPAPPATHCPICGNPLKADGSHDTPCGTHISAEAGR